MAPHFLRPPASKSGLHKAGGPGSQWVLALRGVMRALQILVLGSCMTVSGPRVMPSFLWSCVWFVRLGDNEIEASP